MAAAETLLASPIEWSVRATGTNVTVTASKAAAGLGFRHYVFGVSLSSSAPPAVGGVEAQLRKDSGSVILDGWLLALAAFPPIIVHYLSHPFQSSDNGDVDVNIPALGSGISATAVLKGTTRASGLAYPGSRPRRLSVHAKGLSGSQRPPWRYLRASDLQRLPQGSQDRRASGMA